MSADGGASTRLGISKSVFIPPPHNWRVITAFAFTMSTAGPSHVPTAGPVSAKHIVYAEILSVTTVMRKNSRWSSSSQTYNTRDSVLASNLGLRRAGPTGVAARHGTEEEALMSAFEELKRELRDATGECFPIECT